MRFAILTFLLLILAFGSVAAQDSRPDCPAISVTGPAGIVQPGEEVSFIVNTDQASKKYDLRYHWSTSIGEIVSGQGTSSFRVKWPGGGTLTATVEIKGLPAGCPTTASETGAFTICHTPILVDEFGRLPKKDIEARLTKFYSELSNNQNSQGYIINYGTDTEIAAREKFRHFDRSRITLVRGGPHESGKVYTKLWRVPPGADNPTP